MALGIVLPPMCLGGTVDNDHVAQFSTYFGIYPASLRYIYRELESLPYPRIVLLQNPKRDADISAACFVSSTLSKSYLRLGSPNGRVHRDFHYQCFYTAMNLLIEVNCSQIRTKSLRPDGAWLKDSYICLLEARRNLMTRWQKSLVIETQIADEDRACFSFMSSNIESFEFEKHRHIYASPSISHGLNVITVYPDLRSAYQ